MTTIEFVDDQVQVDADVLAKALRIGPEALKQGMRDGTITSRFERGEGEDAGRIRLTFFSAERRVRMIADESGNLLTWNAVDHVRPPFALAGAGRGDDRAASRARLDLLLDTALEGTFPASDPLAVSFDVPGPNLPAQGKPDAV